MTAEPTRKALDLVYMGTPAFAATILSGLIEAGHRVLAVYTQPPRPAGRGHRPQPSPVQLLAAQHRLALRSPVNLRTPEAQSAFANSGADAAVVAAYGLILPGSILRAPRLGCFNVHASLLPRWRGAAPIQRALLAGDSETGITIMQMEEGLDTGPILLQQGVSIAPNTTAADLSAELAVLGARLILAALDGIAEGTLLPRPQPQDGVTYARKISREDGRLDWRLSAAALERQVRALDPWPGVFFESRGRGGGERIRVLAAIASPTESGSPPGTVLDDNLSIACGEGAFRPLRLQRPGRSPIDTGAFLRGFPIAAGTVLPCRATS
ncbi:MAG: methionyl-tRNA formyltransferase [Alphaproteobacteria bacterium]|nr:methionyl-tRNA formyltransferase [Alphaproteobacteria bacterium]